MSAARRIKKAMKKWPRCPECGGKLGFAFYAAIQKGFEFCNGCNWRREVEWVGEMLRKALA